METTKLYGIWRSMRNRCSNPNNKDFPYYGARGISVCEEWGAFSSFQTWSTENGYKEGLTLDRIDNDGNYEPANCKWTTRKEQAQHRRPRGTCLQIGKECKAMELDVKTQSAVRKIVKENVTEILRNYLTEDLVRKITNEILAGVEWDLGNMEV